MPRPPSCSYSKCTKGYTRHSSLTRSAMNHVRNYHEDVPATFGCIYTGRRLIFRRRPANNMDYLCICKSTFTVKSNLKRHYEQCRAAAKAMIKDGALDVAVHNSSALSGVIATSATSCTLLRPRPLSSREGHIITSMHPTKQARSTGPSNVSRQPPPQQVKPSKVEAYTQPPASDQMQSCLVEQHQPNTRSTSSHHNQLRSSIHEHHRLVLQSLSSTSIEYRQLMMKTMTDTIIQLMTDQWHQMMEVVSGNHHKLLWSIDQQQSRPHCQLIKTATQQPLEAVDSTSMQHQATRVAIEGATERRCEDGRSFTAQEGALDQPTMIKLFQRRVPPVSPVPKK